MIYYLLLLGMTLIGSIAAYFLKLASGVDVLKKMFTNRNLYIGACLYLLSAVLNIIVLKYLDYSVVLPLTSITYIWTMILSYFLLKEKISPGKFLGVTLIIFGAFLVSI